MTSPATQPTRLDAALQRVVAGLRKYEPEQIVLFGSLARGDAGEHSDIDLIVIKDTDLHRQERRRECEDLLPALLGVGVDIIVYTPAEVEGMIERRNPFLAAAFTDGVVVYDRNPIPGAPPLKSRLKEPTMESRLLYGRNWLQGAGEDLYNAKVLLDAESTNGACFYSQQAVEKALKGFLVYRGLPLERTHLAAELADRCAGQDQDFAAHITDAEALDSYYIHSRYPDANTHAFRRYELADAETAVRSAERIVALVESKIPARPEE